MVNPEAIIVDSELRHLVPKHRNSEVALLERSLQEEKGCREALHVWDHEGKLILLDGHTRRELCMKLGFKVPIRRVELADMDAAKAYLKKVQLGRRNTPSQAESYLRGSHYNEQKQSHGGDRRSKAQGDPLGEAKGSKDQLDLLKDDTAEKLSKEYEVSSATIKRDAQFARLLDKVLEEAGMTSKRWELLGGDIKLNRGAVRKLSLMKGRELKGQLDHLLKKGRLPRKERADSPKATMTAKTRASSFVNTLKAKDEKLPEAVLRHMANLLGFEVIPKAREVMATPSLRRRGRCARKGRGSPRPWWLSAALTLPRPPKPQRTRGAAARRGPH